MLLCASFVNAQDMIQLKSGKTEEVQILEINKEKIKFKKSSNLNGPTYSVKLEKVASVKYENGMTMNLGTVEAPVFEPDSLPPLETVTELSVAPAPELSAEDKNSEAVKDKTDSTGNKPYGSVGISLFLGLNLLTYVENVSESEKVDLDFFSPVLLFELDFLLSSKFGLLFGIGYLLAITSDPDMGWLGINQQYDEDLYDLIMMVPLYGGIKIHLGDTRRLHPYGKVNLGYTAVMAHNQVVVPIFCSKDGYSEDSEGSAYGGFLWGFALGIENSNGVLLEASIMMFDGGIHTKYHYNRTWATTDWDTYDSEMDFMFVNVKFGIRF